MSSRKLKGRKLKGIPVRPEGIRATRDGGLFIHPAADAEEGSSIRIPQVTTELGAGFGDEITDVDRKFAAEREPVAHFLTYHMSADVFDKWFIVDDPSTEGGDPKVDETVQDALTLLEAKTVLTKALEYERIYGWSLLVGSFSDVSDVNKLETPLREGSRLLQLAVYPKTKVDEEWMKDVDENSERFGEAVVYKIDRGDGKYLYVHYTRCCLLKTRSSGKGVLDPIWDDLTCGRNIRWGASQWMYRTGGGFPVIKFPAGTTKDQLETWIDSNAFSNLMSRTYIGITGDMDFKFEGAAGRALDPQPFFHTNLEHISAGSGVPEPILRGAQAGQLTGSEVNQQQYYKVVSRIQASLEETVRWVIDHLAEARQIKGLPYLADENLPRRIKRWIRHDAQPKPQAFKYTVEWASAFELSKLDQANAENLKEDANVKRLEYMTVDEVRAMNELDPLPNGEGASMRKPQPQPFNFEEAGDSYVVTSVGKRIQHDDWCAQEGGHWVTIKGTPVCVKEGESVEEAFKRTTGKELEGEEKPSGKGRGKTKAFDPEKPERYKKIIAPEGVELIYGENAIYHVKNGKVDKTYMEGATEQQRLDMWKRMLYRAKSLGHEVS